MKSILITGGAGFIGSHFIERLLRSGATRLVCLDNFCDYYSPDLKRRNIAAFADDDRVSIVEEDFCRRDAVEHLFEEFEVSHVVHLGGLAGVRYSVEAPWEYIRANVEGTLSLLEAARHQPVERFLLISSSTVYGEGARSPFSEDAPLGIPKSPYGQSKQAAEILGLTYWNLHQVPVVCFRPFSIYGPRLRPDLALSIFTRAILRGEPLKLFGDGNTRRDFTHVDDFCAGLEAALHVPGIEGETFNLGCGNPISMNDVLNSLQAALDRPALVLRQPQRAEDMPETFADISKAQARLGYQPHRQFQTAIHEFVAWYTATNPIARQPMAAD